MRCSKARDIIALHSSAEAGMSQWRSAQEHCALCAECARFSETPWPSLAAVRASVPLQESDYSAIRRTVQASIARPQKHGTPLALRFAFATVVVLLIIGAAAVLMTRTSPTAGTKAGGTKHALVARAHQRAGEPVMTPRLHPSATPGLAMTTTRPARPSGNRRTLAPKRRSTPAGPQTAIAVVSTNTPEIHMEIQTSDPDIRIIWIANQTTAVSSESR